MWNILFCAPFVLVFDFPFPITLLCCILAPVIAFVLGMIPKAGNALLLVYSVLLWTTALLKAIAMPFDIFILIFYALFVCNAITFWISCISGIIAQIKEK